MDCVIRHDSVRIGLLAVAFAVCVDGPVRAGTLQTTLDTLVPGGANSAGITLGSQQYYDFRFTNDGPFALTPADVTVRFSNDGPTFSNTLQFAFDVDATADQTGGISIGYRSDISHSTELYSRYGLRFNGTVPAQGVGAGDATVTATVSTVDGSDVSPGLPVSDTATLIIHNDGPGRAEDDNSEFLTLSPTRSLRVDKQFTLSARETGPLYVQVVDNYLTFPEPTAAFLALPAAAWLLRRSVRRAPQRRGFGAA